MDTATATSTTTAVIRFCEYYADLRLDDDRRHSITIYRDGVAIGEHAGRVFTMDELVDFANRRIKEDILLVGRGQWRAAQARAAAEAAAAAESDTDTARPVPAEAA